MYLTDDLKKQATEKERKEQLLKDLKDLGVTTYPQVSEIETDGCKFHGAPEKS